MVSPCKLFKLSIPSLADSRAGDLGTTASEVEESLERNFALANRWGCILLLDEADVFLAQRNKEDFIRNGLVAGQYNVGPNLQAAVD